jgi:peptidoglycan hydrolase CwlO-like protein
LEGEVHALNE